MKSLANLLLSKLSGKVHASSSAVEQTRTSFLTVTKNLIKEAERFFKPDDCYYSEKYIVFLLVAHLMKRTTCVSLERFLGDILNVESFEDSKFHTLLYQFKQYAAKCEELEKEFEGTDMLDDAHHAFELFCKTRVFDVDRVFQVMSEINTINASKLTKNEDFDRVWFTPFGTDCEEIAVFFQMSLDIYLKQIMVQGWNPTDDEYRKREKILTKLNNKFYTERGFHFGTNCVLKSSYRKLRRFLYAGVDSIKKPQSTKKFNLDNELDQRRLLQNQNLFMTPDAKEKLKDCAILESEFVDEPSDAYKGNGYETFFFLLYNNNRNPINLVVGCVCKDREFLKDKSLPVFIKKAKGITFTASSGSFFNAFFTLTIEHADHSCVLEGYKKSNGGMLWTVSKLPWDYLILIPFMLSAVAIYLAEIGYEDIKNSEVKVCVEKPFEKMLMFAFGFCDGTTFKRDSYNIEIQELQKNLSSLKLDASELWMSCPLKTFLLFHTARLPEDCFV